MLVAMLPLLSPVHCLKSLEVGNPGLNSLYLVWTSAVRVDLAYGRQAEELILWIQHHHGLAAARFPSF